MTGPVVIEIPSALCAFSLCLLHTARNNPFCFIISVCDPRPPGPQRAQTACRERVCFHSSLLGVRVEQCLPSLFTAAQLLCLYSLSLYAQLIFPCLHHHHHLRAWGSYRRIMCSAEHLVTSGRIAFGLEKWLF